MTKTNITRLSGGPGNGGELAHGGTVLKTGDLLVLDGDNEDHLYQVASNGIARWICEMLPGFDTYQTKYTFSYRDVT